MNPTGYWNEVIGTAAEEVGLTLNDEQREALAGAAESAHENYGMAFYSPPASDRMDDIERGWKAKLAHLQSEFDAYKFNAESAVRQALRQRSNTPITIGSDGEVFRHGGRTEQIQ